MLHGNDVLQSVTIDSTENDRILIWKIRENFYLLCIVDPSVPQTAYAEGIEATLDMVEQSKFINSDIIDESLC